MKRLYFIWAVAVLAVGAMLLSCSKDPIQRHLISVDGTKKCTEYYILSDWSFELGGGLTLLHTDGLESMALSGSHTLLNREFCNIGKSGRIPTDLGDDIYDLGYAGQMIYGDYIVAMYHPTRAYPDHFITYNHKDGSWIHWKLGNSPKVVIQSD